MRVGDRRREAQTLVLVTTIPAQSAGFFLPDLRLSDQSSLEATVNLLPDFHGLLIVGAEEVVGAVMLHGFSAILSHVED